jgi:hypothetical protein
MAMKTKARNQGQNQDQPVDSEIRRAAERIGYVVKDEALRKLLVEVSDKSGEMLAVCEEAVGRGDLDTIYSNAQELHLMIWQLRWELAPSIEQGGAS